VRHNSQVLLDARMSVLPTRVEYYLWHAYVSPAHADHLGLRSGAMVGVNWLTALNRFVRRHNETPR
jgi:hypothetical protein